MRGPLAVSGRRDYAEVPLRIDNNGRELQHMSAEAQLAAKLAELGLALPPPPEPKGLYKSLVVSGNLVYTSGHLPVDAAGKLLVGRLGADLDVSAGYKAAQLVGLNLLASLRKHWAASTASAG